MSSKLALTREQFITNAKRFHGDKYDYSLVDYKNNKANVTIICPQHGPFEQTPASHSRGSGCRKCPKKCRNQSDFLVRAHTIYGDKYLYDMVDYVNIDTEVIVICPEHGSFLVRPEAFLRGSACLLCDNGAANLRAKRSEAYLAKFMYVHGNKYDYSQMVYINNKVKVAIRCKKHGIFYQTPLSHGRGSGCPLDKKRQ